MPIFQKILFTSFFCILAGFFSPAYAAIATKSTVQKTNATVDIQKVKKLSFKEKIKLVRQIRSEIKATKKISPKGSKSIMQNRLFLMGLIFLIAGLVLGILRIPIISWFGGLIALAGFIMMIVALVRDFT